MLDCTELSEELVISFKKIRAAYSGDVLMESKCRKPIEHKGSLITVSGVKSPGRRGGSLFEGEGWLLQPLELWPHETSDYYSMTAAWNQGAVRRGDMSGLLVYYRRRDLVLTRGIKLVDPYWSWEREYGVVRDRRAEPEYAAFLINQDGETEASTSGRPRFIPIGHHSHECAAVDYACRLLKAEVTGAGLLAANSGSRYWVAPRDELDHSGDPTF